MSTSVPPTITRFAIASVATGVLGLWPLAAGFAIAALVKTRRGRRGKGLALVGLVLAGLGAAVTAVQVLDLDRGDKGRSVLSADLAAGDCFYFPDGAQRPAWLADDRMPDAVQVVPCTEPHNGEVAAVARIDRDAYTQGDPAARAEDACAAGFTAFRPAGSDLPDGFTASVVYPPSAPSAPSAAGARVHCIVSSGMTLHTGTLRTAP
ncbi:DUF4190 domain-containing protein [Kitasatospora sp. NPDC048365]|uniref:DUF4190 domain-containing protein n=1 Tax=Kitasatospora sp. NPDC048365 TaxID=3364050 RepID=UPI003716257A